MFKMVNSNSYKSKKDGKDTVVTSMCTVVVYSCNTNIYIAVNSFSTNVYSCNKSDILNVVVFSLIF